MKRKHPKNTAFVDRRDWNTHPLEHVIKHIYFPIMLMYMDEKGFNKYHEQYVLRMTELLSVIEDPVAKTLCVAISKDVMDGEYYKALLKCKKMFEYESARLNYVPEGVSDNPEGE